MSRSLYTVLTMFTTLHLSIWCIISFLSQGKSGGKDLISVSTGSSALILSVSMSSWAKKVLNYSSGASSRLYVSGSRFCICKKSVMGFGLISLPCSVYLTSSRAIESSGSHASPLYIVYGWLLMYQLAQLTKSSCGFGPSRDPGYSYDSSCFMKSSSQSSS